MSKLVKTRIFCLTKMSLTCFKSVMYNYVQVDCCLLPYSWEQSYTPNYTWEQYSSSYSLETFLFHPSYSFCRSTQSSHYNIPTFWSQDKRGEYKEGEQKEGGGGKEQEGSRETVFQGQKRHFSFEDRTYNILDIVCPEYSGHLYNAGQCLKYSIFE